MSTWSSHVVTVCKSMAYFVYLINFHSKSLPHKILKMLVKSLVFSWLNYALPVWGPAVHQSSSSRINHLHNRAVRIVCGLHKSEHVSRHHQAIGWLSMPLLTQHRTSCAINICVEVFYLILPSNLDAITLILLLGVLFILL